MMTTRIEWLRGLTGEYEVRAIGVSGFGYDAHVRLYEAHFDALELTLAGRAPCGAMAVALMVDGDVESFVDLVALGHLASPLNFLRLASESEIARAA